MVEATLVASDSVDELDVVVSEDNVDVGTSTIVLPS